MRAATIRDGQIAVEEHPDPSPQAGELFYARGLALLSLGRADDAVAAL